MLRVMIMIAVALSVPAVAQKSDSSFDKDAKALIRSVKTGEAPEIKEALDVVARSGLAKAFKSIFAAEATLLRRVKKLSAQVSRERAEIDRDTGNLQKEYLRLERQRLSVNNEDNRADRKRKLEKYHALQKDYQANFAVLNKDRVACNKARKSVNTIERVVDEIPAAMKKLYASSKGEERAGILAHATEMMERLAKFKRSTARLRALGAIPDSKVRARIADIAESEDWDLAERSVALAVLAENASPYTLGIAENFLEAPQWELRVGAVEALAKENSDRAVRLLIDSLNREKGRISTEVVIALYRMTGHCFHYNTTLWEKWWDRYRKGEVARAEVDEKRLSGLLGGDGGGTSFYGLETRSKNIVYVLDVSGSMNERKGREGKTRLQQAKTELLRSLRGLAEDSSFGIVVYSSGVRAFARRLRVATKVNKEKARKWVEALAAQGATNVFDALELAFAVASHAAPRSARADTIFLLSDGAANRGRFVETGAVLAHVGELNEGRNVAIHVIGIGENIEAALLDGLAEGSGGRFLHRK